MPFATSWMYPHTRSGSLLSQSCVFVLSLPFLSSFPFLFIICLYTKRVQPSYPYCVCGHINTPKTANPSSRSRFFIPFFFFFSFVRPEAQLGAETQAGQGKDLGRYPQGSGGRSQGRGTSRVRKAFIPIYMLWYYLFSSRFVR